MSVAAIVADFGRRGFRLRAEGDWLDCDFPLGELTDVDLAILREHKAALLAFLSDDRTPPSPSWEELAAMRWGDDPAPGIVIDVPDRARLMDALDLLPEGPGDADDSVPKFSPVDLASPDCPAWAFDGSLAVRTADVRAAVESGRELAGWRSR